MGMTGSPDSADHARFLAAGGNKVPPPSPSYPSSARRALTPAPTLPSLCVAVQVMLKPLELVLLDRALANLLSPAAIAARTDALRAMATPAPAPPPVPLARASAPAATPSASVSLMVASPVRVRVRVSLMVASPAAAAPSSRPHELLIVDDSPRCAYLGPYPVPYLVPYLGPYPGPHLAPVCPLPACSAHLPAASSLCCASCCALLFWAVRDCQFVARALAGVGFVCEEARDGQAAVDALERRISQVNQGRRCDEEGRSGGTGRLGLG